MPPQYSILIKMRRDFLHPAYLIHMKRTAAVAMAAAHTGVGPNRQVSVVVCHQSITGPGQIVILVNEANIQTGRTGLAVVAVDTSPLHILWRKHADDRVILFLVGGIQKFQNSF